MCTRELIFQPRIAEGAAFLNDELYSHKSICEHDVGICCSPFYSETADSTLGIIPIFQ